MTEVLIVIKHCQLESLASQILITLLVFFKNIITIPCSCFNFDNNCYFYYRALTV